MLLLRIGDVDSANQVITLRGKTTKSGVTRRVPISTQRLQAVLEWLRLDAVGGKKPDETLVSDSAVSTYAGTICDTRTRHDL
jgi:integrase